MKQVADYAGLSAATVSRVLNGSRPVQEDLKVKVWDAVKKLNYKPNVGARFMKGQTTNVIGMLVPDVSQPFFSAMIAGAILKAGEIDHVIIISTSDGKRELEKAAIDSLSRTVVDGLIYCPVSTGDPLPQIESFKELPIVVVGRRNVFKSKPHVYTDNVKGGYLATKYLLRLGRKRVGFLAGFWSSPCTIDTIGEVASSEDAGKYTTLDRYMGYRRALEEEKIEYDPSLIVICGYDYEAGYIGARELLERMVEVDSVIAANDLVAAGVIGFLTDQGINVPDQVSVVGYDNNLIAPITIPTLTSVDQDPRTLGAESVVALSKILSGKEVSDTIIDVKLTIRNSTSVM
ncbi:LacI family DNA-binding transcriptional regulator, partial [Mesotoga prima]